MNYYNEIKNELINNEIIKKVKDYAKNKSDLSTYYKVGKILSEAGKHYGEGIIKEYSIRLTKELNKIYSERTLRRFRQFYNLSKETNWSTVSTILTWSHYSELLKLKSIDEINYYTKVAKEQLLSIRDLRKLIKSNDYERLDSTTKQKLKFKKQIDIQDYIKNPIFIKNQNNIIITEKVLQQLILEDIPFFLNELGNSFSFISNEYKIKIGDNYNYIDLLLYNIEYNCYVVVELKITDLKKEHIGQIEVYMNYIDNSLKTIHQNKTIGIIICKKDNKFIMEYCSDPRILSREYKLI